MLLKGAETCAHMDHLRKIKRVAALFGQCPRYLCCFSFIIEHSVFMALYSFMKNVC